MTLFSFSLCWAGRKLFLAQRLCYYLSDCSVRGLNICGCAGDVNLGVVSCEVCARVMLRQ